MRKIYLLFAAFVALPMMAEQKLLLDSIVETDTQKEVFVYNTAGEAHEYYKYNSDYAGGWSLTESYIQTFTYDAEKHLASCMRNMLVDGNYVQMYRVDYTYDEHGCVATETILSHSAWGNPWNNMARYTHEYVDDNVLERTVYEMWGTNNWDPYMTYIRNAEQSTETMRVMDKYWTGYESEGSDGQIIYYYSMHEVTNTEGIETTKLNTRALKVIENGNVYILRNGIKYDATGSIVR